MQKLLIFGTTALLLFAYSCGKEAIQTYTCTGDTPTYTNDIKAILDANCATSGCHNAASRAEGIDLSTYAKAKSEAQSDAFLGSIEQLNGYKAMPEGRSKLSDSNIQKIYCWIENGTPE